MSEATDNRSEENQTQDAYTAFMETEPCKRCGEGESWTVKGPDGLCIGQSWTGDNAECNAEEMAQSLNAAFELGQRYFRGVLERIAAPRCGLCERPTETPCRHEGMWLKCTTRELPAEKFDPQTMAREALANVK